MKVNQAELYKRLCRACPAGLPTVPSLSFPVTPSQWTASKRNVGSQPQECLSNKLSRPKFERIGPNIRYAEWFTPKAVWTLVYSVVWALQPSWAVTYQSMWWREIDCQACYARSLGLHGRNKHGNVLELTHAIANHPVRHEQAGVSLSW